MFLPQVEEVDIYALNGQQQDDINSIYEFIDQVVLGNQDYTPDDEDDDTGQIFRVASIDFFFQQPISAIEHVDFRTIPHTLCGDYSDVKIVSISLDIVVPPPEI